MSRESGGTPPKAETDNSYQDQFKLVAEELLDVMGRHPGYYHGEASYATAVLSSLDEARQRLEKGEIARDKPVNITLFGGLQSRNVAHSDDFAHNHLVTDLYIGLNRLAGLSAGNYYDIEKDIADLAARRMLIDDSDKTYLATPYWVKGDQIGLADKNGQPYGIRLKITDNILASFKLGNYGRPDMPGQMTFVDLAVVHG